MFIGYYGAGFIGARSPKIKLWQAFIAVQFIDFIWAAFVLLGIERGRVEPGFTAASPLDLYHMPYSHSLLFCALWAVVGAVGFKVLTRAKDWAGASIFDALVLSHWLTDWVVHMPDLPLWPGSEKVGFGLWQNLGATLAVEIGLLVLGGVIYAWRRTRWRAGGRLWGGGLLVLMVAVQGANYLGGTPIVLGPWRGLALLCSAFWPC